MKKNILAFTIIGGLLLSSTSVAYGEAKHYNKYTYTQKVLSDNFDLDQINDKLEDEYDEYILALRARNTIKEMSWDDFDDNYDTPSSRFNASKIKLYNHLSEGKDYHDKYIERQKKENEIILEAESNFFNYIHAEKNLKNAVDAFNLTKTTFDTKKLEHKLGKISDIDLLNFEKTYNDSYVAQLIASNKYEATKHTFNQYISEPIESEITLQDIDINLPAYKIESLEDTVSTLVKNSYQMSALTLELERLKMDRVLKGRYSGFSNTKIELENIRISIEELEKQLEDIVFDLDYQLRTKYNEAIAAENTFKSAELSLKIEQNNYSVAKIKHKNQMISELEYIHSKQTYDSALNNYFDAKLEAYKVIKSFNNFLALNSKPVKMDFK